jgi:hypothetical protein
MTAHDPASAQESEPHTSKETVAKVQYVKTAEMRSDDDHDTCLRPLGLCELGGSCDSCWYRPDHPRFQKK